MKIKCVALVNADGKPVESSPWLTVGKIYYVMSILRDGNGKTSFQIVTNDRDRGVESLGYYPAIGFEIVSQFRPSSWRERVVEGLGVEISPISWQHEGFWEALYEGNPEARLIFERERDLMIKEEP